MVNHTNYASYAMTASEIYNRILMIERRCRDMKNEMSDDLWKTHPDAIEYRSLLKCWWELPKIPGQVMLSIAQSNRPPLTAKGNTATKCHVRLTPANKMYKRLMGGGK